jgi:ABC-type Fe3+/spermidine/putrescine transport system ATPase subunit
MEVTFDHVSKNYGDVVAVHDLNLKIAEGSLHFLLGPSGCGKTTTLRMLAGLETTSAGRILFGDKDVTALPAAERGIGMVFQNYALWPHMTVAKNIEYGLSLKHLSAVVREQRLKEALELTQLTRFASRLPGQLSGGQQQRVALARALAIRPTVLLLDEPLSNLDAQLRLEMRDNISRIHRQTKITTVYVTHDQKEALSMGTEVSVLRAGRLIQSAPPRQLYHHPATPFIARFIGETNLVNATYRGEEQGLLLFECGFGHLRAKRQAAALSLGQAVTLSFRPETIEVSVDGAAQNSVNPLRVFLEHLTYLGESEQLALRTADQQVLRANIFNPPEHDLSEGVAIVCNVDPEHILVLPVELDQGAGT